jgi:alpha-1,2-mannosyltransferase
MAAPVGDPTAAALGLLPGGRGRLLITLAIGAFAIRAIPVLTGGGLQGLHGYDDGVYFGGATALVHGALPYRDFLLLHPPGMVLGLSPFAMLGTLTGDPAAFAVARVSIMVLGAVNAVLVALVAARYNRLAGLIAGALYAVWNTASNVERTTDLHGPQNTLLLLGLLALARSGRIDPRRAALSGVFLGLAVTVQLWQAVSVVVIVWWVLVRGRGDGWARLRPAAAYLAGAGIAIGFVCLPFFITAPDATIRYLILDQIGRPSVGVDAIDRLRVLEGFAQSAQMPPVLRQFVPDPIVVGAAGAALAIVVVTAWICPWTRLWAALALAQTAVVLVTPSFFNDYPSFAAPAATLVLGTAVAVSLGRLARRGARPLHGRVVIGLLLAPLAAISLFRVEGERLPLAELESDISRARCVSADSPALLVLTSAMRRNLEAGCPVVLDPTGISYDTDRDRPLPRSTGNWRLHAPGYQAAMVAWYTSGDVALFVRPRSDGLTRATQAAIARRLSVEVRRGIVVVRFAAR